VLKGTEIQAGKEHDLAVLIAHGTAAWSQQHKNAATQKTTQSTEVQFIKRSTAEILTILLANLIEHKNVV